MTLPRRYAALGMVALVGLQVLWHARLLPPASASPWLVALLFSLPMLPGLALLVARRPSAIFWGGVAALFYFCHGVTEAWTVQQAWPLALAELGLSVWTTVAGSWDGMRARFAGRKARSTNV